MAKKSSQSTLVSKDGVSFPLSEAEQKLRYQELALITQNVDNAISEATAFADKYHLVFHLSLGGTTYNGNPTYDDDYGYEPGWSSSSSNC